jgi:hypothetical protein
MERLMRRLNGSLSRSVRRSVQDVFQQSPLDLRFALQKTLDPRVSFTRASSGTYVGSDGLLKTATTNEPRFDHNPTTGESLGLLVEEPRTNSIRNNTMVGAVAGTPGTLPTNWSVFTTLTGLTRQIVGIGTEDGITYIDVRLSGTPNTAGSYFLQTETNTSVNASNGQTWTSSAYVRLTAGNLSGVSTIRLSTSSRDSGGNVIASGDTIFTPTSATLITQRFASAYTNVSALTAFELLNFAFALSGTAIDFTLRIGLPQLEQGAFATSAILTTGATATRAADVANITGAAFSSFYNQAEGTVFAEARTQQSAIGQILAGVSTGSFSSSAYITKGSDNVLAAAPDAAPSNLGIALSSVSSNVGLRSALAFTAGTGSASAVMNGGTVGTDASTGIPNTMDRFVIGSAPWNIGTNIWNGTIKRLTYWPVRLANTTLQQITQP